MFNNARDLIKLKILQLQKKFEAEVLELKRMFHSVICEANEKKLNFKCPTFCAGPKFTEVCEDIYNKIKQSDTDIFGCQSVAIFTLFPCNLPFLLKCYQDWFDTGFKPVVHDHSLWPRVKESKK
jgi:hypothetical protein